MSYILTKFVSDPPMTFRPRPDFPLETDIRVGRPSSTGRFDGSSFTTVESHGNTACRGDKSGDVSDDSKFSSDIVGYFADGTVTVHDAHQRTISYPF